MSKGVKLLEHLLNSYIDEQNYDYTAYICIEKELQALEILRKNPQFCWYVIAYKNVYEMIEDRKSFLLDEDIEEIERKFNLLKEVLS